MLFYSSIFILLIAVLLIFNNLKTNSNVWFLSGIFICNATYGLAHNFLVVEPSALSIALSFNHFAPTYLLIGPLLFFYVRGTLQDSSRLRRLDFLHFLPAFLQYLGMVGWLFMPWEQKLEFGQKTLADPNFMLQYRSNLFLEPQWFFLIRPLLVLIYIVVCFRMVYTYKKPGDDQHFIPGVQYFITRRWLFSLMLVLSLINLLLLTLTIGSLMQSIQDTLRQFTVIVYFFTMSFAVLGILLLFFPQVMYGMPRFKYLPADPERGNLDQIPDAGSLGLNHLDFSPNTREKMQEDLSYLKIIDSMQQYMLSEKPFTDPNFTLVDLARKMKVPQNQLRYCFSEIMKVKFTDYRTQHRLEYAKSLISDGKTDLFTLETIAQKAGFGSRSSFYTAFKAATGVSPSEYYKLDTDNTEDYAAV